MTYIDPILFSGGAQIKAYTDGRVKDWEDMKNDEYTDFDHYFEKIMEKWDINFDDEQSSDDQSEDSLMDESLSDELTETTASATTESTNAPVAPNLYIPDGADVETKVGLTEEEKQYIRAIALMEWNFIIMNRRTHQKVQKKKSQKIKKKKKELEAQELQFLAKLEAKHREQNSKRRQEAKKS